MSLRTRLTVFVAGSVALAVLAVSAVGWFAARRELRGEVDDALRARVRAVAAAATPLDRLRPADRPADRTADRVARRPSLEERLGLDPFGEVDTFFQVIGPRGVTLTPPDQAVTLPVDEVDRAVAQDGGEALVLRDLDLEGLHLRMATGHRPGGGAVQVARSLEEVDGALRGLGWLLAAVGALGVVGAAAVGTVVARRSVRPVERLTTAAEQVAGTQTLAHRIDVESDDEIGRLARAFNEMLEALEQSRVQQEQLVADAGHELRTPLTSIRTNVEMLDRAADLPPAEREALVRDLQEEVAELSALIGELVDLATTRAAAEQEVVDVRLDELVERAAERARRRSGLAVEVETSPVLVRGRPGLLERAVGNLLDNACKFAAEGASVDVTVCSDGTVEVADRGPGIAAADTDRIWDRFYRADTARSRPGSGLGLAIVRQVVTNHGGDVFARAREGGGAVVGFRLPVVAEVGAED
ncbi:MAG TPA: HAMP domain-containing sensor histidine kinase [Acidimicrobiia bacterium]|nr:HAMP domain-containing sensor histidine kinase [Acidimicrobiia bacterium]